MRKKNKITSKLSRVAECLRNAKAWVGLKVTAIRQSSATPALILSAVLLASGVALVGPVSKARHYDLTLLMQYGPQIVPVGKILVTNVSHEADGSVCFTAVAEEKNMCIKFDFYDLTEAEVQ